MLGSSSVCAPASRGPKAQAGSMAASRGEYSACLEFRMLAGIDPSQDSHTSRCKVRPSGV